MTNACLHISVVGKCLLILDGAKCHFDPTIAATAEQHEIELLCLPSNSTHELQPFDKTVFGPMETAWDDEVQLYWDINSERTLGKIQFCQIFSKVWQRSVTPHNVKSGFEACGIFPFNPGRIPEEAYIPSEVTHWDHEPTSNSNEISQPSTDMDVVPQASGSSTFKRLVTPEFKAKNPTKLRAKALNYKAVRIRKNLFASSPSSETEDDPEDMEQDNPEDTELETHEQTLPSVEEGMSLSLIGDQPAETFNCEKLTLHKDDFLIAFVIFNFGTKKEVKKYYVGCVKKVGVGRQKKQIEVDFLRKVHLKENAEANVIGFSYPSIRDLWKIDYDQVVQILSTPQSERRGRYFFNINDIKCKETLQ